MMGEAKRRHDLRPGPTGEFPHGMARSDDKGELRIAISDRGGNGNIHIGFGVPVDWIAMPQEQILQFATMLLKKAGAKVVEVTF